MNKTTLYSISGFFFGLGFPLLGILLLKQQSPDLSLLEMHQNHVLLWIVDLAPFVITYFAYYIGLSMDQNLNFTKEIFHLRSLVESPVKPEGDGQELKKLKREKQSLEIQLEQSHALGSQLNYDLQLPLGVIFEGTLKLTQNPRLGESEKSLASSIQQAGLYVSSLVKASGVQIQKSTSVQKVEAEKFNVTQFLHELEDLFRFNCERTQVKWKSEYPNLLYADNKKNVYWLGDTTKLKMVLVSLFNFMIQNLQSSQSPRLVLHVVETIIDKTLSKLKFELVDNGPGLSETKQKQLFSMNLTNTPDSKNSYKGLGLGLAQTIVKAMGGQIHVQSEVGVGTKFTFELNFENCQRRALLTLDGRSPTPSC